MDNQTTDEGLTVLDLRPCLMVAAKVSRVGGQHYHREDEQSLTPRKEREQRKQWTTKKVIDDEEEHKEAGQLQHKCKYKLGKLGRYIPLGVIMAADKRDEVEKFRREWKAKVEEFNGRSTYTKLRLSLWVFEVKGDNLAEMEQVLEDLRTGLEELETAYRSVDPGSIREVLKRMTGFVEILPERVGMSLTNAVKAAKKRADAIARGEKRVLRMQRRIEETLGPEADADAVQAELERLANEPLNAEIVKRTKQLTRLNGETEAAVRRLEEAKLRIDTAPIQLARFAVRRKLPDASATEKNTEAGDRLLAAEAATKAARVVRPAIPSSLPVT